MRNLSFIFSYDQFIQYIEWLNEHGFKVISTQESHKMFQDCLDELHNLGDISYAKALLQQNYNEYHMLYADWLAQTTFETEDPRFCNDIDNQHAFYIQHNSVHTCETDLVDSFIEEIYPEVAEIIKALPSIPSWAKYYCIEGEYVSVKDKGYKAEGNGFIQQYTMKLLVGKI